MLINHQNPSNMSLIVRTRSSKIPDMYKTLHFQVFDPVRAPLYPGGYGITVLIKGHQTLFESVTPNPTKNHKIWKNFQHYKLDQYVGFDATSGLIGARTDSGTLNKVDRCNLRSSDLFTYDSQYTQAGVPLYGIPAWYVAQPDGGFIPLPDNLEKLKERGLKAMQPKLKAELSGLVSLYEAKDILSIKGSIKGLVNVFKHIATKIGGHGSKPLAKIAVRAGADGYLQWMFNLKPLISDISGIYRTVANYERRINDFVNRSGKLQTAHWLCWLPDHQTSSSYYKGTQPMPQYYGAGWWSAWYMTRTQIVSSAVFRCEMQYNFTLSAFQREHAKVLGYLDALGVNFNPKYVWNVIPWSFVVDWVIDVGQWLDQFEVKNLEPKVNILQYCWSVRKQRLIKTKGLLQSTSNYWGGGSMGSQYFSLPTFRETSYRRGTDMPSSSSFTTSGLSSTQLSLGAALIVTRRRRNTRK